MRGIIAAIVTVVASLLIIPGQAEARKKKDNGKDLFTITVDTKGFQPYRIAVVEPIANDRPLGKFVRKVATNNLRIATSFRVLSQRTYPKGWPHRWCDAGGPSVPRG